MVAERLAMIVALVQQQNQNLLRLQLAVDRRRRKRKRRGSDANYRATLEPGLKMAITLQHLAFGYIYRNMQHHQSSV
jgi:hypothetical protein